MGYREFLPAEDIEFKRRLESDKLSLLYLCLDEDFKNKKFRISDIEALIGLKIRRDEIWQGLHQIMILGYLKKIQQSRRVVYYITLPEFHDSTFKQKAEQTQGGNNG